MASQNGLGGGGGGMYNGMNNSILPPAGQYSDMQLLMQNMESLSGWLQQNREEWMQVQEGLARVERLQGRLASNGQLPLPVQQQQNGEAEPTDADSGNVPTIPDLQQTLTLAQTRITDLENKLTDQTQTIALFEEALTESTDRIRHYIFGQQEYIKSLREQYTAQLQQSRYETMEAQWCHHDWQAGLSRLNLGLREALKSREKEVMPWRGRLAALKVENRILRRKVGWEVLPDSEDEDKDEGEDSRGGGGGGVGDEVRGRGGQGFVGRGGGGAEGGVDIIQ